MRIASSGGAPQDSSAFVCHVIPLSLINLAYHPCMQTLVLIQESSWTALQSGSTAQQLTLKNTAHAAAAWATDTLPTPLTSTVSKAVVQDCWN